MQALRSSMRSATLRYAVPVVLLLCAVATSHAVPIGFDGTTVSYTGYCCSGTTEANRVTNILTTSVGPGLEFTANQVANSGINSTRIIGADYDIGTSTIDVQNWSSRAIFNSGQFNGPVLTFSGLAAPITNVAINSLSTYTTPQITFDPDQVFINVASTFITNTAQRLLLDVSFAAPPPNQTFTPNIPVPTTAPLMSSFPAPANLYNSIGTFTANSTPQFGTAASDFIGNLLSDLGTTVANSFKTAAHNSVNAWDQHEEVASVLEAVAGLLSGVPRNFNDICLLFCPTAMDLIGFAEQFPQPIVFARDLLTTLQATIYGGPVGAFIAQTFFLTDWGVIPVMREIAEDPPDLDFQVVASATFHSFPSIPASGNVALDQWLVNLQSANTRATGFVGALNTSFDRYTSAYNAGDPLSAGLQVMAMLQYMALTQDEFTTLRSLWGQAPSFLMHLGFDSSADAGALLDQLQAHVVQNGLPAELVSTLLASGFTDSEIGAGVQNLLALELFGSAGDVFGQFPNLSQSVFGFPQVASTVDVDEPATLFLVMLAGILWRFSWHRNANRMPGLGKNQLQRG